MRAELTVLWVSCTSSSAPAELRDQCKRLSQVEVCTARTALSSLSRRLPHVVIFEFEDPTSSELQLLQSVKRSYPSLPILMVTTAHSENLAVWAFRVRVWNYLVTPVPLRELKSNLEQLWKIVRQRDATTRRVERPGTMIPVPASDSAQSHSELATMQRIIQNIRADQGARLRISELASQCGMTRFSFSRLFRTNFGCSCREYVMRLRIEAACKMLEAPHPSVTHVAIAAGFTDASHFARLFRKYMKKSPAEYARMASTRQPTKVSSSDWDRTA